MNRFLTHLAIGQNVAASTQNQAVAGSLFLYEHVLERPLNRIKGVVGATGTTSARSRSCWPQGWANHDDRYEHIEPWRAGGTDARSDQTSPKTVRFRVRRESVHRRCIEERRSASDRKRAGSNLRGRRCHRVSFHQSCSEGDRGSRLREVRTCADRQQEFLSRHGDRFSEAQRERIARAWKDYFDRGQTEARNSRIWFNLTLGALANGGADRLLTYFGGEVVYMPLTSDQEVAAVLRTIGQPLIVECALRVGQLHTFSEIPRGRTWLSTYHVTINQGALRCDVDAYTREPV